MLLQKINRKMGFTLIEVLICIVIIAICASMAITFVGTIIGDQETTSIQFDEDLQDFKETPKEEPKSTTENKL
jgi:prepilin-type N-terminal cleavage/methylation domain-containing protein